MSSVQMRLRLVGFFPLWLLRKDKDAWKAPIPAKKLKDLLWWQIPIRNLLI